jgi:hypothetical protein
MFFYIAKERAIEMKKIFAVFLLFAGSMLFSQDKGFGAGIIIGEPTGISLKGWISSTSAVDAAIAYSFLKESSLHIHVDYLQHFYNVIDVSSGKLPLYVGIGGRIKVKNNRSNADDRIGVRIPFGIAYHFSGAPVDIFLEIAPLLDLTPKTSAYFNGGLGVRYFF